MGLLSFLFGSKDDKKKPKPSDDFIVDDRYSKMKREEPDRYYAMKSDQERYLDKRDQR